MIRTVSQAGTGQVEVTFVVPREAAPGAPPSVVGDFNDWDPAAHPLTLSADAREWYATLALPAGVRYAFRYRTADGHWFNDEAATTYEDNGMGETNAVLEVSPLAPLAAPPPSTPAPGVVQARFRVEDEHAQAPPDQVAHVADPKATPQGLHPEDDADHLAPDATGREHPLEDSAAGVTSNQTAQPATSSQAEGER